MIKTASFKKSQISMEFLAIVGIIIILLISVTLFSMQRNSEIRDTEIYINAISECEKIADLITGAYMNNDGTEIEVHITYFANISDNIIRMKNSGDVEIGTCNFYGKSINYSVNGDFKIKNDKGIVRFDNL